MAGMIKPSQPSLVNWKIKEGALIDCRWVDGLEGGIIDTHKNHM